MTQNPINLPDNTLYKKYEGLITLIFMLLRTLIGSYLLMYSINYIANTSFQITYNESIVLFLGIRLLFK